MAYLTKTKTEDEIKKMTVSKLKKAYNDLAADYDKLTNLEYIYCPQCGEFITSKNFYTSNYTRSGIEHLGCKKCILDMATDFDKKDKKRYDNREKTINVLRMMNLPFIETDYKSQVQLLADDTTGRLAGTAFQAYITMIKSLPNYRGKTFEDSEYDVDASKLNGDVKVVQKTLKTAMKRFGNIYNNKDLIWLENEYQDWVGRYPCENKSQELLYQNLCVNQLNINKFQAEGKDTKDLIKTMQDLMTSLQIKPSQSNSNALTEAKTFGELIKKWENEKPIPEPEDEFKDVDKIGLYVDVFFKGHLSKMMGLKNGFSALYDKFISKYTVTKPQYDEDTDSEILFEQIFGSKMEEE